MASFQELVSRYHQKVYMVILGLLHNRDDALEVAQETFFRAYRKIGSFEGGSSFYTWIYRIVMNVTIDWLRKKQIKGGGGEFDDAIQLKEVEPASKTVPKSEALPHEMMERSEIRARIEKAIAQLSPEQRAVILMKQIEEMQYHEIAEALGCSIGTVMSRLFYARKKLQNLLRDVYENI